MHCRFCDKPIGMFSSLLGREHCSDEHSRTMKTRSARTLRDMGEATYYTPEHWVETQDAELTRRPPVPEKQNGSQSGGRSALTAVGLFGLAIVGFGLMGRSTATQEDDPSNRGLNRISKAFDSLLAKTPRPAPRMMFEHKFNGDLRAWVPAPGTFQTSSWGFSSGLVHPGGLRIWNDSRNLADYRFRFEGKVQDKAISWVVRAPNHKNYYATKLTIPSRKGATAEVVRYAVIQGVETKRQRLPIPFPLDDETFYNFEVTARGDKLVTTIAGQVVDSYRDARFRTGGVGFFSERGEKAAIRFAQVTDAESFLDRLRGYFTFGLILPRIGCLP